MSKYLKLSPNVAGVTLLALGNGAPDLSSIIIAGFTFQNSSLKLIQEVIQLV
jgi:Ca2+/Na+ antiporter